MTISYDPVPDAIAFLARRSPLERHAIARLLATDGPSLQVLAWIVDQPDCDLATVAMTFWRLRSLPPREACANLKDRACLIETIAANVGAGRYQLPEIAWDGYEAWDRAQCIGAAPIEGLAVDGNRVASILHGPFGTRQPRPAADAFLDEAYDEDDIFDSLWRTPPNYAAAADWLVGKPADIWMAVVDDVLGAHPDAIYGWMLQQPECPRSVAGQIFWVWDPMTAARLLLEDGYKSADDILALAIARWRAGDLAPSDLDFSRYAAPASYRALLAQRGDGRDPFDVPDDLLDPPRGRVPGPVNLIDDFDYWRFSVDLAGLVPRPRAAAIADWQVSRTARDCRAAAAPVGKPGSPASESAPVLERLFYGGAFTGSQAQIARCWKQFNIVMIAGGLLLLLLMRGGARTPAIWLFFALVAILSLYQSSAHMGGARRIVGWWLVAVPVTFALAFVFRWIDAGQVG